MVVVVVVVFSAVVCFRKSKVTNFQSSFSEKRNEKRSLSNSLVMENDPTSGWLVSYHVIVLGE